jgi:hypothetical protein
VGGDVAVRWGGPKVAMLHVGGVINDDGSLGVYREIPYLKPAIEVGGVKFVWGRWPGVPYGVLEVFGPVDEVRPFFAKKAAELLAFGCFRYDQMFMN